MEQVEYTLKENITNMELNIIIDALHCYFIEQTELLMNDGEMFNCHKVHLTFDLNNKIATIQQKFEIKE